MTLKTSISFLFSLCFLFQIQAQQLLVLNGGSFGSSTDVANLGIFNATNNNFQSLDSIGVTAVQDLLIEDNRYAYVAASDSLIKYDLYSGERLAAAAFGGVSTVHLDLYQDRLLVGNYYGLNDGNLRIFDKTDLSFIDSIPEISKGATEFIVIGDSAYIRQNHSTSSFQDSSGYLAIVDLSNMSFVRNDSLNKSGEDLGRLINVGDTAIYSLNPVSNTITYYQIASQQTTLLHPTVDLNPRSIGGTVYYDGQYWYFPYDSGIGSYDLVNNSVGTANIVQIPPIWGSYAFAMDTANYKYYLSYINYANQQANIGVYYDNNGDSLGTFPVGSSPEVLEIWYSNVVAANNNLAQNHLDFSIFPNPSTDYFKVRTDYELNRVELFDLQGRLVQEWLRPQTSVFTLSEIPQGQYYLRIWTEKGSSTKPLLKH